MTQVSLTSKTWRQTDRLTGKASVHYTMSFQSLHVGGVLMELRRSVQLPIGAPDLIWDALIVAEHA